MKKIGQIINELRLKQRMTQRALASKVGVSATAISQWERDENEPKSKHLVEISKAFNISLHYLTGESNIQGEADPACILIRHYPSVLAAGGCGSFIYDEAEDFTPVPKHAIKNKNINDICCIGVAGDSMNPVLFDGSIIAIDQTDTLIKDGKMYVFRHEGLLRVKCLNRTPKNLIVQSYNNAYETESYQLSELNDFEVLGRVFWYSCEV